MCCISRSDLALPRVFPRGLPKPPVRHLTLLRSREKGDDRMLAALRRGGAQALGRGGRAAVIARGKSTAGARGAAAGRPGTASQAASRRATCRATVPTAPAPAKAGSAAKAESATATSSAAAPHSQASASSPAHKGGAAPPAAAPGYTLPSLMERRSSQRVDEPTPEQKRLDVWTLAAFVSHSHCPNSPACCSRFPARPRASTCRPWPRPDPRDAAAPTPPPLATPQTGLLALAGAVSHWLGKVLDPAGPPLLGVEAVAGMGRREEDLSPEELRRWRALQRRLYHESGLGEARARDPSAGPPGSEYERAMADKHGAGASSRAGAPGADEVSSGGGGAAIADALRRAAAQGAGRMPPLAEDER